MGEKLTQFNAMLLYYDCNNYQCILTMHFTTQLVLIKIYFEEKNAFEKKKKKLATVCKSLVTKNGITEILL